ncbi:HEAT repeat domain-containing protein [Actinomyces sp. Marseille-P3109]|uniref:HEAT repeat domain-containing protein n=1 Tax=Actinomyces sp. Marseille-P3109 TaxID=2083009 RepID=UPI001F189AD4|nr:HEAT repeat domain-containing protein [Actinomyces sp. Marseille-P3109]
MTRMTPQDSRVAKALSAESSSIRLRAALAIGTGGDADYTELLVERCAIEPDFFVRDMLSWALTRLPPEIVLPRLHRELCSGCNQARSQALHTLSKVGDKSAWPWITREMLGDPDDGIARTAWRTAVVLVPEGEKASLAEDLTRQLGRGDRSVQLSLSRALIDLGEFADPVLEKAAQSLDPRVAAHARATELLRQDPETGFEEAISEARRDAHAGGAKREGAGYGCGKN